MLTDDLKNLIDYVINYVGNSSNDWFTIKRELVNVFPPKKRSLFSRRHFSTKKHTLNDFDYEVIAYWEKKTGNKLVIDEKKLHPKNWKRKPKGWGLQKYNRERAQKLLRNTVDDLDVTSDAPS